MELFRILMFLYCFVLLISCSASLKQEKLFKYDFGKYIVTREKTNSYDYLLEDSTISQEGDFLFKGKSNSPFGEKFNDDSGIYLPVEKNTNYEIVFFNKVKNKWDYYGLVIIPKINLERNMIKILKENLQKIFDPNIYLIVIIKGNNPILKYYVSVIY
ncbi:MAG: hypothetical protein PVH88_15080 [Ignavibacteria bacterium]|jgi:hypothetical protein